MTFMKEGAGLINRPTTELSELGNGIAMVEAFSHVVVFKTGDGLVLFDTSLEAFGGGVLKSLRGWTDEPVSHICYTHGLPIAGKARIAGVLDAIATALEMLVEQTVAMMNEGARLDEIVHAVKLPSELMNKPYLRPVYDEPEFVIHNIWRLYGGWYDGNPVHLKPSPDAVLAAEMASLAGGADKLAKRAAEVARRQATCVLPVIWRKWPCRPIPRVWWPMASVPRFLARVARLKPRSWPKAFTALPSASPCRCLASTIRNRRAFSETKTLRKRLRRVSVLAAFCVTRSCRARGGISRRFRRSVLSRQ